MPGLFTLPMLFRIAFRTSSEVTDVRRAHAKAVIITLAVCGDTRSHQRRGGRCYVRCILKEAVFLPKSQNNQFTHSLHTYGPSGLNSDTQDACKPQGHVQTPVQIQPARVNSSTLNCFMYKSTQLSPWWRGRLAGHAWHS
jgi:hypothetical protein